MPAPASEGRSIGPYRPLKKLGSGSFGQVYAARHNDTQELAAVKIAHDYLHDAADFQASFRDEIEVIGRVKSRFVPRFISARHEGRSAWMASELIPGLPLSEVIAKSGQLPEKAVWRLGASIIQALEAIHAAESIHRDLRPNNVLLTRNRVWVIDFSLAHLTDLAEDVWSLTPRRTDSGFMPPEEAKDGIRAAGKPADIFALGAMLVFAATGHPPLEAAGQDLATTRLNLGGLRGELHELAESCLLEAPPDRPRLEELAPRFRRHSDAASLERFAAVLPEYVVERLERYADELAEAVAGRGRAELGWGRARVRSTRRSADPQDYAAPGPLRWKSRFDDWVSGSIAVRSDYLVAACLGGTVAALRTTDGRVPVAWRDPVKVGSALHAGPLIFTQPDGRAAIYVGAPDGRVHEVDLASGADRVVIEAAAAIEGTPVAADHRIYAVSADGAVHFADLRTDDREVSYDSGVLYEMGARATGALTVAVRAAGAVSAAVTVIAADAEGVVHAIDGRSGQPKWRLGMGGLVLSAPLPAGRWLYFGGTDGVLRQVGIEDSEVGAEEVLGAPVHIAPTCDRSLLYVGGSDGMVQAYDVGDGRTAGLTRLWQASLGAEIAGLTASGTGVYATAGYRLLEIRSDQEQNTLARMSSLVGGSPVIGRRRCYVAGLSGSVICLALRR